MYIQIVASNNSFWREALTGLRHDVYHLPEYLAAEARTIGGDYEAFLVVEGNKLFFVPYLLYQWSNPFSKEHDLQTILDVVSPYGYLGILLNEAAAGASDFVEAAMNEFKYALRCKGVCSAFLRMHPILNQDHTKVFRHNLLTFSGETVSIDLTMSKSQIIANTRRGHLAKIRKCRQLRFEVKVGRFEESMYEFLKIYTETMVRVKASLAYHFTSDYFKDLLKLNDRIHLGIVKLENEAICACLLFESCKIVQVHLSGTKSHFLSQSPFIFLLEYVQHWAKERGNEFLHLGGGVGGRKDSLFHFKAGFSKQRHPYYTLRLIISSKKYHDLVALRAKALSLQVDQVLDSDFFPAYCSRG